MRHKCTPKYILQDRIYVETCKINKVKIEYCTERIWIADDLQLIIYIKHNLNKGLICPVFKSLDMSHPRDPNSDESIILNPS